MYLKQTFLIIALGAMAMTAAAQASIDTQRQYLSGHGCDDMVNWDFYCTGGRNAGKWTKIGVPSCWELQGFGTYQYGMRFYGKATPEGIADEKGKYKYEFTLPQEWEGKQIELVFEAVMTDAKVTINGRKAGNGLHQGGFYRFTYDVSDRIFFGKHKNRLEVEVSKESSNSQVNMAERRADYWNFGGIFRPVFIVAKPAQNINRVAIDAKGDGHFMADCYLNRAIKGAKVKTEILDEKGKVVASNVADARNSDEAHVDFQAKAPKQWTAETPHLYTAVFTLQDAAGKTLHRERQKFGFRTIEYRASDGVYINGQKVIFKGVNRHSFRPETGRTLSKAKNIEDVKLIKSMNMNAVRLSHYPADPEFLEACDSLGLYVECELSGWHWAHPTIVGKQLVKEMITRDENHPSIIFWSNGNEGGFNYGLEPDFAFWDKQKRVVLYPWANRNGFETKHYRSYGETQEYMRQKEIFMPTEFLHGLYDGGHGAGLKDYWDMMMANPRCAGGFLWDLMDQGVVRTDKNNYVDCMGNFGADGIVGPHAEKEGSYYTIKEVWCPVQLTWNDVEKGELTLSNQYNFVNLKDCRFSYRLLQMPAMGSTQVKVLKQGNLSSPDVAPGKEAQVKIPMMANADAVEIKAVNHEGEEIMTWSRGVKSEERRVKNSNADGNYTVQSSNLQVQSSDEDYPEPPAMPEKLPKLVELLISRTPEIYKPAVAHAIFPPLATHLWQTSFRYIDNVVHEATLSTCLLAGTGAGKSSVDKPIRYIMEDIRKRDAENLKREKEWKEEVTRKGANKDKRKRPDNLVIQEIDADMTSPAFVMRTAEAQGRFLYTSLNELDQFDALRGSGNQQFRIMCLAFDPFNLFGQQRVGVQSVTERVTIRFNWNASTTIQKGQRYFSKSFDRRSDKPYQFLYHSGA